MAEFKASDGTTIRWGEESYIEWDRAGASKMIDRRIRYMADSPVDDAMAEWYQHRRDEELGRWRDPLGPDFVVYPAPKYDDQDGRCIRVVNESTGRSHNFWEHFSSSGLGERAAFDQAARAYFDAHPVEEPKQWYDAKPGEAWVLTVDGASGPAVVMKDLRRNPQFLTYIGGMALDDPRITAGRRIWPEPEADG